MADPLYRLFTHGASGSGDFPGWSNVALTESTSSTHKITRAFLLGNGNLAFVGNIGKDSGGTSRFGYIEFKRSDGSVVKCHSRDEDNVFGLFDAADNGRTFKIHRATDAGTVGICTGSDYYYHMDYGINTM